MLTRQHFNGKRFFYFPPFSVYRDEILRDYCFSDINLRMSGNSFLSDRFRFRSPHVSSQRRNLFVISEFQFLVTSRLEKMGNAMIMREMRFELRVVSMTENCSISLFSAVIFSDSICRVGWRCIVIRAGKGSPSAQENLAQPNQLDGKEQLLPDAFITNLLYLRFATRGSHRSRAGCVRSTYYDSIRTRQIVFRFTIDSRANQ